MADYVPPAGDAIVFNFSGGEYTPPPGDEIVFNFIDATGIAYRMFLVM